ncbi:MAG: 50S ribosomal protein L30 [Chromatiales bacterium]
MATKKATKKKGTIRVTLRKSTNGRLATHKACVAGLGLRRIGHTVELADTPATRGMIRKVSYLVSVEG